MMKLKAAIQYATAVGILVAGLALTVAGFVVEPVGEIFGRVLKEPPMRRIDEIIVHCTATPQGMAVSVADIDRWHRQRGFAGIGYHFVVYLDGTVHKGRPVDQAGAHCKGHNAHSIGICYVGGLDTNGHPTDTRTPAQKEALRDLVTALKKQYPHAKVYGHWQFANKTCPCFSAEEEYGDI